MSYTKIVACACACAVRTIARAFSLINLPKPTVRERRRKKKNTYRRIIYYNKFWPCLLPNLRRRLHRTHPPPYFQKLFISRRRSPQRLMPSSFAGRAIYLYLYNTCILPLGQFSARINSTWMAQPMRLGGSPRRSGTACYFIFFLYIYIFSFHLSRSLLIF